MAQKPSITSFFVMIIPMFLFSVLTHAQPTVLPEDLCKSTIQQSVCNSILTGAEPGPVTGFARIALEKSQQVTQRLLASLATSPPSSLAHEDCQFLARLSVEHLTRVAGKITGVDVLGVSEVDESVTLLSAALSNYDTCHESIFEVLAGKSPSPEESGVLARVSDGAKVISVCLALFRKAWPAPSSLPGIKPPERHLLEKKWSEVSVRKMSERERMIYERVMVVGRKLLQVINMGPNSLRQSPFPNHGTAAKVAKTVVVVNPSDPPAFSNITAAVAAAPTKAESTDGYYVIYVVAGIYQEYVTIPSDKTYVMIVGDGIGRTIITGNKSVGDNSTTFASATLAINGKGFVAANITVRNTAGAAKHQAVAVRTSADMSAFFRCSFEAYQDTLYVHSLRQFYKECEIFGTVDFVFGNAAAVFQSCNIFPRLPLQGQFNAITAQGRTDPNQNTGISIQNCTIKPSTELVSGNFPVQTYLGRPWKEYSRTVYLQNFMDGLIDPKGWTEWMGDFALKTLYYAEFKNTGPGSDTTNRVTWPGYHVIVNEDEAESFTVSKFIVGDSWLPVTGVPFFGGLMA
ncbi:PREDICTED: pectinesterase-like [Tarenaya hassleriana]|uniref:pectinesterase-like n=1 Tax=Tarenaya hassleriana TaxID=28532 RepID=UPI00053C7325|nr:PREDICTED: pectinesterase-like [Tarenaya hassleriana]